MSRMNLSEYVGHMTIFSCYGHDCVLVVGLGLGLGLGLDLVSGWLVYTRICTTFDCHCHTPTFYRLHTHTHTHTFFTTYNSCYSESTVLGSDRQSDSKALKN